MKKFIAMLAISGFLVGCADTKKAPEKAPAPAAGAPADKAATPPADATKAPEAKK